MTTLVRQNELQLIALYRAHDFGAHCPTLYKAVPHSITPHIKVLQRAVPLTHHLQQVPLDAIRGDFRDLGLDDVVIDRKLHPHFCPFAFTLPSPSI